MNPSSRLPISDGEAWTRPQIQSAAILNLEAILDSARRDREDQRIESPPGRPAGRLHAFRTFCSTVTATLQQLIDGGRVE